MQRLVNCEKVTFLVRCLTNELDCDEILKLKSFDCYLKFMIFDSNSLM